jgi:hypothetical protein
MVGKLMRSQLSWSQGMFLLAAVVLLAVLAFKPPPEAERSAVVVELFTSEGCSSCPPADELLMRFVRQHSVNGAEIIPLGFHVDYWDHQGWRDRFSSHAYTERQQQYAALFHLDGPYTPQMVVDGEREFVGSDSGRAEAAISRAAGRQQTATIDLTWKMPGTLLVRVTAAQNAAPAAVNLAITEDNLSNSVAGGENGGRVLHHSAVVRDFRMLGQMSQGQFHTEVPIKLQQEWKQQDLRVVVFVQGATGSIDGAASVGMR